MKRYQTRYRSKPKSFLAKRWERKGRRRFILTAIISIFLMYSLFAWLLPTLIGSLSFINKFKSAPIQQVSIAENPTLAPPVLNIPYEATNTALIAIRGYSLPNTTVEIYLDDNLKATTKTGDSGGFTTDSIPLTLGTNSISGKTVDEKGSKSLSSKPIRIIYTDEKPTLDLSSPSDNQTIKGGDKKVTVSGTTDSDKDITITINGTQVIVGSDGKFSQTIDINDGDNNITVTATDTAGNSTEVSRKVTYQSS